MLSVHPSHGTSTEKNYKNMVNYPSELLYLEFKVFNISQIYINILLKFVHKNRKILKLFSLKYNAKRSSDNICLAEPEFYTTVAFNLSSNFCPRLCSRFMGKFPNMKYYSVFYFKNATDKLMLKIFFCNIFYLLSFVL